MDRSRQPVTDTELQILDALWTKGPLKIREITDTLYPRSRPSVYATVQSLLDRLEAKGYVRRDRSAFAHVFSASVERGAFIGGQLQDMADKVCDGSLTPLLLSLVERAELGDSARRELLKLIEEADDERGDD